jgi:hypothetical protein
MDLSLPVIWSNVLLDFLTIKKTSLIPWKVASEAFDIFSRGKKVPFYRNSITLTENNTIFQV